MDQSIEIRLDTVILFNTEKYKVLRMLDAVSVLTRNLQTQEVQKLLNEKIEAVIDCDNLPSEKITDLVKLSEKDWEIAKKRFDLVTSFLNRNNRNDTAENIAKNAGIHKSTFYRWIKKYQCTGLVSSLINDANNGGKGNKRLNKERLPSIFSTG